MLDDDGSSWLEMVRDAKRANREITPIQKRRMSNGLSAEMLSSGMSSAILDHKLLEISFPDGELPTVRIALSEKAPDHWKNWHSDFISGHIERGTEALGLMRKVRDIELRYNSAGSYHVRNDIMIVGHSVEALIDAVGEIIHNPMIKDRFLGRGTFSGKV